ncbi:MAG: signal peptidase I [Planctomycetota bacterium]
MSRVATIARGAAGLAIVVLLARTFVAIGWLQPIVVSGGSMAPRLLGDHLVAACRACDARWPIDRHATQPNACLHCGDADVAIVGDGEADQLLVRRVCSLKGVRRGDTVVLRSPEDASKLLVKRVLGLPGEEVAFIEGDVWIDGQRLVKSLDEQRRVRIELPHEPGSAWLPGRIGILRGGDRRELVYCQPLTDDLPYNADVSRRLVPVTDSAIEFELSPIGSGQVLVDPGWPADLRVRLGWFQSGLRSLQVFRGVTLVQHLPLPTGDRLDVAISTFDRRLVAAVNSAVVASLPLTQNPMAPPKSPRLVNDSASRIKNLRLYRDVYYEAPPGVSWTLGADEFFVVGDNQAISRDSRHWDAPAGVPGRLILGIVAE